MHSERIVSNLIGLIYEAAGDPPRWQTFLETFGRALKSSGTNLFAQDLRTQKVDIAASIGIDPAFQQSYEQHYRTRNVYLQHGSNLLRTGSVCVNSQMCPDRIALRSEFFNDWIAPQKQRHGLLGVVWRQRSVTSMVGAIRSPSTPPFSDREVSLVQSLIPHLQRAVSLHRRIADLENQKIAATNALNHWSLGVLLLDAQGRVLLMNRRAEEIVCQKDGLLRTADGLCAPRTSESLALRALVKDAVSTRLGHGGHSGGAISLTRPSLKRALNVLVAPLFPQNGLPAQQGAVVALFVSDPETHEETKEDLLRYFYGLTPAEATLAAKLVTGDDLKDAAETLSVSMNTARTHLKRVFQKTGTRRQAELVRLLLQSPFQVRPKR